MDRREAVAMHYPTLAAKRNADPLLPAAYPCCPRSSAVPGEFWDARDFFNALLTLSAVTEG